MPTKPRPAKRVEAVGETAGAGATLQAETAAAGSVSVNVAATGSTSGNNGPPPRVRRPTGSGFDRQPGRRPMKEYPLTKGELYGLASLGGAATLCFSLGSAAFGYAATITKDMAFASNVPETRVLHDGARLRVLWIVRIVCLRLDSSSRWRHPSQTDRGGNGSWINLRQRSASTSCSR